MVLVEPSEQIKLGLSMASFKMEKGMGSLDGLANRVIFKNNSGMMVIM
jgi:hypothetical protein